MGCNRNDDSGIMKWPTLAVCFGPPPGPSELLVWTERELGLEAGVVFVPRSNMAEARIFWFI